MSVSSYVHDGWTLHSLPHAALPNPPFDSSAYIDAVLYLHMTAGSFAKMWLPITNVSTD